MALNLPDFPWDSLAAAKARASEHPDGIVDLSVGTPVDPTPQILQDALAANADAHGYPQVWGTPDLREAIAAWYARRRNASHVDPDGVIQFTEVTSEGIGRNAAELVRKVKAAQYIRNHPGEVCPAKWEEGADTLAPSLDLVGKI